MEKLPKLSEEDVYSLIPSSRLYRMCDICKCSICAERPECRYCYLCAYQPFPVFRCSELVLKVFSKEPYKTYLSEVDEINGYKPPKKYR